MKYAVAILIALVVLGVLIQPSKVVRTIPVFLENGKIDDLELHVDFRGSLRQETAMLLFHTNYFDSPYDLDISIRSDNTRIGTVDLEAFVINSGGSGKKVESWAETSSAFFDHVNGGSVVGFYARGVELEEGADYEISATFQICSDECKLLNFEGTLKLTQQTEFGSQVFWNVMGV